MKTMQWEQSKTNFDRNLAVVIGIDRYNNPRIQNLSTPVSDARALADLLETEYEYKPENVVRLFDEAATLTGLQTLLTDTLPDRLKPTNSDRLIFYFAGHGLPKNSDEGPTGYLVPQDAQPNREDSFLPMKELYDALSQLQCHHLLVILDCCFAGTFCWAGSRNLIAALETIHREHYDRFIRFPAWQTIASSAHDQEALDFVKLSEDLRGQVDVDNKKHSPFALALLEALQDGEPDSEGRRSQNADYTKDGVIAAHELIVYLSDRVSQLSQERQAPGLYPLKREYDKGEFIFVKPGFNPLDPDPKKGLTFAPKLNEENNPYRGLKPFEERHAQFFFGRQKLVEELSARLAKSRRPLTVVLGISGSGKSSLVKAGLLPYLRQKQAKEESAQRWYILAPLRPGKSPFAELAKAVLPVAHSHLIDRLARVSFLDATRAAILDPKSPQKLKADSREQPSGEKSFDTNKLAQLWQTATPEAKLLLIVDYFQQLQDFCDRPQERAELSQLHEEINNALKPLAQTLQKNLESFNDAIAKWSQEHPHTKILLVIDQLEELITMSQDDRESEKQKEWQRFLSLLRIALAKYRHQLHVIVTLRSDFEPRFRNSALKAHWKSSYFPVRGMNSDELRDAIEGPALRQALYFEPPELVGKLIDEVGQMPGALPLLSFTLSELYIKLHERWREYKASDRALQIEDYNQLGGVAGALTGRATQEYDRLMEDKAPEDEYRGGFGKQEGKAYQATMKRVMLRMVAIEGGGVARRRVPESELVYPDPEENKRVAQVSDRLVKARLLVKGQETGVPYVEPAHDFLVRGWERLLEWIKQEASNLALQKSLSFTVSDWYKAAQTVKQGYKNSKVIRLLWDDDPRLPQVKAQQKKDPYWLNQQETTFVDASVKRKQGILFRNLLFSSLFLVFAALAVRNQNQSQRKTVYNTLIQSDNFLSERQQLKALENAIQAGKSITNSKNSMAIWKLNLLLPDRELEMQAINSLQRIGYQITQLNRWKDGTEPITTVSFDPTNDKIIASASEDGSIKIWNLDKSKRPYQTLRERDNHGKAVWSLSFSPDGSTIISGSRDGRIRLWSKDSTGQFKPQPDLTSDDAHRHKGDGILAVAFSHDGNLIASVGADAKVSLWRKNGTWKTDLGNKDNKHKDAVYSVSFSPNDSQVVTGGIDGIKLWNRDGAFVKNISRTFTYGVTYSPDGSYIASGHGDGKIKLWESDGKLVANWVGHKDGVRGISFSPKSCSSSQIVSAGKDRIVKLWDGKKGTAIATFEGHGGDVRSVSFNSDCSLIASAGADNTIQIWKPEHFLKNQVFSEHGDVVYAVDFSNDGLWIATASADQTVRIWRRKGKGIYGEGIYKAQETLLEGHISSNEEEKNRVYTLAFNPDKYTIPTIASADQQGQIFIWQLNEKNHFSKAKAPQPDKIGYQIKGIAFNANGSEMAATSSDRKVRIWKKQRDGSYKIVQCLSTANPKHPSAYGLKVTFSPDKKLLAVAHEDGSVILWKKNSEDKFEQKPFDILSGHTGNVNQVAFGSDSSILASAGSDGIIQVWQRNSQGKYQHTKTFGEPNESVYGLAFYLNGKMNDKMNGKMIASAGQDYTVKIWDLDSSQPITLSGHTNRVFGVAFSPDGKTLASVGWDQKLILWNFDDLDLNKLLPQSCDWAKDYLQHSTFVDKSERNLCPHTSPKN